MSDHLDRLKSINKKLALIQLKELARLKNEPQSRVNFDYSSPGAHFEGELLDVQGKPLKAKAMAYYLPQFYPFAENDEWWGKGFTEWTNVRRGQPRFLGHQQPHIPLQQNYYDLRNFEVMQLQAELARKAGLHAWCFYYYRFGEKRLLDIPVNNFLAAPEVDIHFSLMWANENWTRTWDGKDNNVLMSQEYLIEHDTHLIDDLAMHFQDKRYLRLNGKPVFYIYRPALIPDAKRRIEQWRELLYQRHDLEVTLHMAQIYGDKDPRPYGLDGAIEFPPHKISRNSDIITKDLPHLDPEFSGEFVDYQQLVRHCLGEPKRDYPLVKSAMPSWDNEARRPNRGLGFAHSSPERYQAWLEGIIDFAQQNPVMGERIIGINAWNEWAEGAHLEADAYYGYAYLNATARALVKS